MIAGVAESPCQGTLGLNQPIRLSPCTPHSADALSMHPVIGQTLLASPALASQVHCMLSQAVSISLARTVFFQSEKVGGHVCMGCVNKVGVLIIAICYRMAVFYVVLIPVIIMLLLILSAIISHCLLLPMSYIFKYSPCSCELLCNSLLFMSLPLLIILWPQLHLQVHVLVQAHQPVRGSPGNLGR